MPSLSHEGADAIVGALVLLKEVYAVVGSRRKYKASSEAFTALRSDLTQRFDRMEESVSRGLSDLRKDLQADIKSVRVLVIGEDGENGLRSDVRKIEKERDRERDERHERNGELQVAITGLEIEQAKVGGRVQAVERDIRDIKDGRVVLPYDRRTGT